MTSPELLGLKTASSFKITTKRAESSSTISPRSPFAPKLAPAFAAQDDSAVAAGAQKTNDIHASSSQSLGSLGDLYVVVDFLTRSSSGLFTLEKGWEDQDFEDIKYTMWRRALLDILPNQSDYPLLVAAELTDLIKEDFL